MPWTWKIDFGDGKGSVLCHWAVASKKVLLQEGRPSPEAKPVHVRFEECPSRRTPAAPPPKEDGDGN